MTLNLVQDDAVIGGQEKKWVFYTVRYMQCYSVRELLHCKVSALLTDVLQHKSWCKFNNSDSSEACYNMMLFLPYFYYYRECCVWSLGSGIWIKCTLRSVASCWVFLLLKSPAFKDIFLLLFFSVKWMKCIIKRMWALRVLFLDLDHKQGSRV